jgi:hypothetical protein
MLAAFVTFLVVVATLAILLMNAGCTGMFFNRPPQGSDAMGLVVPVVGIAGGALILILAAILASFRASSAAIGLLHSSPVVGGIMVVAMTLGAALAAGMVFILWCDAPAVSVALRGFRAPIGIAFGVVGPIVLAGGLLAGVWIGKDVASARLVEGSVAGFALRALPIVIAIQALVGYGLGGCMLWRGAAQQAANIRADLQNRMERDAARAEHMAKPIAQRVADELAEFSMTAPLWSIVSYLPGRPDETPLDDDARRVVVERALKVEHLDQEIEQCMQSQYHLYRQGAMELMLHAPAGVFERNRESWGSLLVRGVHATGESIACRPAWMTETFDVKPDPLGHVETVLKTVERFKDWQGYPRLQELLRQLADDAGMLNADKPREKLLALLAKHGYQPREVRSAR